MIIQGTWQFVSVALLQDKKTSHGVFDDLESILWVLLFVAIRYFRYEGDFPAYMFDEKHKPGPGAVDREEGGGILKSSWLTGQIPGEFVCLPLQNFFNSFRTLHDERRKKSRLAGLSRTQESRDALEQYKTEIQQDLRKLLAYFDNVLDDPTADWSDGDPIPYTEDPKPFEDTSLNIENTVVPLILIRDKKRKQDAVGFLDGTARPPKRIATQAAGIPKGAKAQVAGPSRRTRTATVPRKIYNLRPRKKFQN